jgi:hypothetical protein
MRLGGLSSLPLIDFLLRLSKFARRKKLFSLEGSKEVSSAPGLPFIFPRSAAGHANELATGIRELCPSPSPTPAPPQDDYTLLDSTTTGCNFHFRICIICRTSLPALSETAYLSLLLNNYFIIYR